MRWSGVGERVKAWHRICCPGTSGGGRGGERLPDEVETVAREVLRTRYLTRQRRTVAAVCREVARECRVRGLRVRSRGTVLRRIARLDRVRAVSAREGGDAARTLRPAGGTPPEITGLLEQVQADHTPVDVIKCPSGRPSGADGLIVLCASIQGVSIVWNTPIGREAPGAFL